MNNTLSYKGYCTYVQMSMEDQCFFGKIEGIQDLVTYESESFSDVENAFRTAVDDYISACEANGKTPDKPFKGSFNIRITPDLHRAAALRAMRDGISLNQFVGESIEQRLNPETNTSTASQDIDLLVSRVSPLIEAQIERSWNGSHYIWTEPPFPHKIDMRQ